MIPIGEESTREENVVKPEEGNESVADKAPPLEEKAEDKKGKIKSNPWFFYFNTAQCWESALRPPRVTLRPVERRFADTKGRENERRETGDFLR